jgi:hypothetical protein
MNLPQSLLEKKFGDMSQIENDSLECSSVGPVRHRVEMLNRVLKAVERIFNECEILDCH